MSPRPAERVALAAGAAHASPEPLLLTGRAENHLRGVEDLDDTIARLLAYRDAGADALYAPGHTDSAEALLADGTAPPASGHVPRETLRAAFEA